MQKIEDLTDVYPPVIYDPYLNLITGSVHSAVLLKYILDKYNENDHEPFYKFKQPCGHEKYVHGQSFCEQLLFSRPEVDTAMRRIAQKINKKTKRDEDAIIWYWTDIERVTWYQVNIEGYRKAVQNASSITPKIYEYPKTANIYLMKNNRNGYYKIGRSIRPPVFREKNLQAEEPSIELLMWRVGLWTDEPNLHEKMADKRIRGEWFDLDENDIKFLTQSYFDIQTA